MKAATIASYEAQVNITEIDKPVLNNDSVLMKVHAASLNPIDNVLRSGALKDSMSLSFSQQQESAFSFFSCVRWV